MATALLDPAPLTAPSSAVQSAAAPSARRLWAGRVLTGLAVAFLVFDTAVKLAAPGQALAAMGPLGWQPHHLPVLAAIETVCLVLYLVPRTAPLGAVLWTGYLGGAVATHLRVDNPLVSHVLFPVYVAALVWGGLYLRDARVRTLLGSVR